MGMGKWEHPVAGVIYVRPPSQEMGPARGGKEAKKGTSERVSLDLCVSRRGLQPILNATPAAQSELPTVLRACIARPAATLLQLCARVSDHRGYLYTPSNAEHLL